MGETAESEGVRFGCEGSSGEVVVISGVFGSEAGGEWGAGGDLDPDRGRRWRIESVVDDRESKWP
jgi:hypothetical protein